MQTCSDIYPRVLKDSEYAYVPRKLYVKVIIELIMLKL